MTVQVQVRICGQWSPTRPHTIRMFIKSDLIALIESAGVFQSLAFTSIRTKVFTRELFLFSENLDNGLPTRTQIVFSVQPSHNQFNEYKYTHASPGNGPAATHVLTSCVICECHDRHLTAARGVPPHLPECITSAA